MPNSLSFPFLSNITFGLVTIIIANNSKNTIIDIRDKIVLYNINDKEATKYNERLNELKNYEKLTDVVELKNVFVELQSILKSLMFNYILMFFN